MQNNHAQASANWKHAAYMDLEAARKLANDLPAVACFHAQQAAEKLLKAMLVLLTGDAPRVHQLQELAQAVADAGRPMLADMRAETLLLAKYYIPTRYPDALDGGDIRFAYSTRSHSQPSIPRSG